LSWLTDNGASYDKLDFPAVHPTKGYRCALIKPNMTIKPDEPMVSIPYELMICAPNCLRDCADPLGITLHHLWQNKLLSGDPLLCMCICREVTKGVDGHFWPYLDFMLQSDPPSTIQRWSEEELVHLQSDQLLGRIQARLTDERNMHSRAVRLVTDASKRAGVSEDEEASIMGVLSQIGLPLYTWAWHIIQARAFGRRLPWSALVPMADCLNHANVCVRYALSSVEGGGKVGAAYGSTMDPPVGGFFTLFPSADNTYGSGCEAFNSYGRRTNDHLMLDYGFCLEDNEWERVPCRVSISSADDDYKLRKRGLAENGYGSVRTLKLAREGFCSYGIIFFRVANMTKEELESFEGRKDVCGAGVFSISNEIRALSGLLRVMRALNEQEWVTGVDEDVKTLEGQMGERERMGLVYRVERKKIVAANIQKLEECFEFCCNVGERAAIERAAAGAGFGNPKYREYLEGLLKHIKKV